MSPTELRDALLATIERHVGRPDGALLDFATKADRDARMADFERAEWDVTPLTRPVRAAQYGEWTEEAR